MSRKHHCGKAETASYRTDIPRAVVTDNLKASVVPNCSKNVSPKTRHRVQEELITRVSSWEARQRHAERLNTLAALD